MKTAERKRSSSGPSTSHKKRKSEWSESFARDLEAVEKEDVVAEEVTQLDDEIKIEEPEFQEQIVEMESSESIEKTRMEMEMCFKQNQINLLTSEITMLKKEKMELKADITLQKLDVGKLQNDALDLKDKLLKQQNEIMDLKLNESRLKEELKTKADKVNELALQLKTEMLKHKTEMETLSNQHKATSIENEKLKEVHEKLKDAFDKIWKIGNSTSG